MLLVVNPNPAVDRVSVVSFREGSTVRPEKYFEWPGGSGVHAAHIAQNLGADVEVVAFVGGLYGQRFQQLAAEQDLTVHGVETGVETRGTYSIIDDKRGNILDIAEHGNVHAAPSEVDLLDVVRGRIRTAEFAILSGSVPPGISPSLHRACIALAKDARVRTLVDLTGEALTSAVDERPWMIKASLEELRRDNIMGSSAGLETAKSWLNRGVRHVCVSLAGNGVLWLTDEGARRVWVDAPVVAFNSIGAGDTFVGAVAASLVRDDNVVTALRQGVAAATANLVHVEPGECTSHEVAALLPSVRVTDLDDETATALLG